MKLSRDQVGNDKPLFLIAGPCVIESRDMVFHIAETMKRLTEELAISYVFKASFDKANRTSHQSFRGVGITRGFEIFS